MDFWEEPKTARHEGCTSTNAGKKPNQSATVAPPAVGGGCKRPTHIGAGWRLELAQGQPACWGQPGAAGLLQAIRAAMAQVWYAVVGLAGMRRSSSMVDGGIRSSEPRANPGGTRRFD